MENLRKEFVERLEKIWVAKELRNATNALCDDTVVNSVQVSRVERACFSWCVNQGINEIPSPLFVYKVDCEGNKCCERTREYCLESRDPIMVKYTSETVTSVGDDCSSSTLCEFSSRCDQSCDTLFE